MAQFYTNPDDEANPWKLPDAETFYVSDEDAENQLDGSALDTVTFMPGWYYWHCFPGCLPDSDPFGPFESAQEAIASAREE